MRVETLVVEGPLAQRMARYETAESGRHGLQILEIEGLAARLAGGFLRPVANEDLETALAAALAEGGFAVIEKARRSPGMIRAAASTLRKLWRSGLTLEQHGRGAQAADVAALDGRVRALLPPAALAPPDLARAAIERVRFAPVLLGPTTFRTSFVDPVWRPMVEKLGVNLAAAGMVVVARRANNDDRTFIDALASARVVACPDQAGEVLEAVRWARSLLASGDLHPRDVAIAASDTSPYDDCMAALVAESGLPVHFSHGVPALATADGQTCAALADLVLGGLAQDRVRRLLVRLRGAAGPLGDLPRDALDGVPEGARLDSATSWANALAQAAEARSDGFDPRVILPWIELLAAGSSSASRLGDALLSSGARDLWARALRRAPAEALETALADLRVADGRDPAVCIAWASARHLAGAPRAQTRLIGLASGSWPRGRIVDALLPDAALGGRSLEERSAAARDRDDFAIVAGAASALVLSRARRNAQGRILSPSPLLPEGRPEEVATRSAPAPHALGEADRLFSRPEEASDLPHVAAALACARLRRSGTLCAYDGLVRADHPAILRAFARRHSASSLTLLLRDPLGWTWRYALGWRSSLEEVDGWTIDAGAFGELVHAMIAATVSHLEPDPGLSRAEPEVFDVAVEAAARKVRLEWPLHRATPPQALWEHTVSAAAAAVRAALVNGRTADPATRSWSEVAFGGEGARGDASGLPPWDASAVVEVPGTGVRVAGRIDRVDLRSDGAVRLTDYKTARAPAGAQGARLRGGAELQRVVYALAARTALPGLRRLESRLVHLGDAQPKVFRMERVDEAIDTLADHLRTVGSTLRQGLLLPGPDARLDHAPSRLALPASSETYFAIKDAALGRAQVDLSRVWRER